MNLIEIYIQEVTQRLPEKIRGDIALELRLTIEDMLPDDYSQVDVKDCLQKLGNPATLASKYRDRPMHLIGPRYFDLYVTLLKTILPIAAVISLIVLISEYPTLYIGDKTVMGVVFTMIGKGIWGIIDIGMNVFFWLTLTFAILERTDKGKDVQPYTTRFAKWSPDDLKNITYIPKKKAIKKFEVFGNLMWLAIWATFNFFANKLVGVYKGGGIENVIPAVNQEVLLQYWPIVLIVIGLEIALAFYKLIKGQWTKRMAICNTAFEIIATIVFIVIVSNPNLMNQDFITYMADLLTITTMHFETWIVGGGIFIFILSAAINVFAGYQTRIR